MTDWMTRAVEEAAQATPQDVADALPTVVEGRTLVVDGDYLAYYAAGNDETPPARARHNAIEKITAFKNLTGSDKVVIHLTDEASNKGWRYVVATVKPYQGQRNSGRKPKNWRYLRDWLETYEGTSFKTKTWTDREADDGMAYHAAVLGSQAVIATADKDMRMFPGIHIDWKTYDITIVEPGCFAKLGANGKLYGHKWFWQQMLQGDTADNIPGLEKYVKPNGKAGAVGEKTAEKLLNGCSNNAEAAELVLSLYSGYYDDNGPVRFVEQAVLLWMREDKAAKPGDFSRILPDYILDELSAAFSAVGSRINQALEEVRRLEQTLPSPA